MSIWFKILRLRKIWKSLKNFRKNFKKTNVQKKFENRTKPKKSNNSDSTISSVVWEALAVCPVFQCNSLKHPQLEQIVSTRCSTIPCSRQCSAIWEVTHSQRGNHSNRPGSSILLFEKLVLVITSRILRIPIEHKQIKCSLASKLQLDSI